ncbi:MAG: fluoride efflux transporter CrcB [Ignavibacteriales bacterium]|nr:fluoride efflux transporter CrcB [Ignavibacteriales bacterium]
MIKYLYIGLGGGVGSMCRYGFSRLLYRILGDAFPYGTLAVNVLGCFIIGFAMTVFEERFLVQPNMRLFITIGILGGFTTFSTFSFETVALLRSGDATMAAANALLSLFGCLAATWGGMIVAKLF